MELETRTEERQGVPIDETDDDLCRALWLGVIVQAMIDVGVKSRTPESLRKISEVLDWLNLESEAENDFNAVCNLAGVDPSEIRGIFRQILNGEIQNVDFRATKKALLRNREREDRKRYFRRVKRNEFLKLKAKRRRCCSSTLKERKSDNSDLKARPLLH